MAEYELYVSTATGQRIASLSRYTNLTWTLSANNVGQMALTMPRREFDDTFWAVDRRLEVWRQPSGGPMQLAATYWLRAIQREATAAQMVTLKGPSLDDILDRRIVAYPAASAEAAKSGPADDVIKAYVRENLGSDAGPGRDLSGLGFTVQPDAGQAPSVTKAAAWRKLLPLLQELADISANQGTPLWFGISPVSGGGLLFWTRTGQPGADRTGMAQPFSLESGALSMVRVKDDWRDEANHIYGAGQGTEDDRLVIEVADTVAQAASPYNRREALADGRVYSTTAGLADFGQTRLRESRARRTFEADLLDVPGARLGLDWQYGDRVVAEYEAVRYEAVVTAIRVTVSDGLEQVAARLTWSE